MTDYQRFEELSAMTKEELHVDNGVGTLSEKYLHIFLKNYFEPDRSCHEVKVGRFTADILSGNHITEIQTHSLSNLKEKIEYYLLEGYDVTVVHPIARIRKMISFDPNTGNIGYIKNHPHIGNWYDAIPELIYIKYFLDWEHFDIRLIMFDIEEYREIKSKPGAKRQRTKRFERIPFAIGENVVLDNPSDYLIFVPDGLPDEFVARDFARCAKIPYNLANMTLNILTYLGVTEHFDNVGRYYKYRLNKYFKDFG